ncbi:hypothetical protein ABZP36_000529 [Zizania latifolia]
MLIIPGIEHVVCYDIALDLPSKPKKIAIVGGGYIALEFAGTFNDLKGEVHVFIRQKEVLSGFDEEVIDFIAEQMSLRGITFHTEHGPLAMSKSNDGLLPLKTNKKTIAEFMYVMFAIGRRPNTKNLGLEEIGVKMDKNRAIMVDEYSRALVDSVWAVEDATVRINLSLVVLMDGGALAKIALGGTTYGIQVLMQRGRTVRPRLQPGKSSRSYMLNSFNAAIVNTPTALGPQQLRYMTILSDSSAAPATSLADDDDGGRAVTTERPRLAADEHGFATCSLSSMAAPSVTAMYALFAIANLIVTFLVL